MTIQKISPQELHERLAKGENVQILDVRSEDKFQAYHIEQTTYNISKSHILDRNVEDSSLLTQLPKEQDLVVTCTTGNSASKCASILASKDYNVLVLEGGITAWKDYLKSL